MKSIIKKTLSFAIVFCATLVMLTSLVKVSAADADTFDWTAASYSSADESTVVWEGANVTITLAKESSSTATNNYLGGTKAHTRIYKGQTLTFSPENGEEISSVVITATSSTYAGYFVSGSWSNATATNSGSTVTVTPTDGTSDFILTVGTATRATQIVVNYAVDADASTIEISGDATYAEVGDEVSLTANTNNITGTVVWSSSDENVATVDQSGNVTAVALGQTTIKATADEVSDEYTFTVYPTDGSTLSIADALKVCEYTGTDNCAYTYSVTGVIESIDTGYDESYDNITVTITDGTDSIKAYRMAGGSDLKVGYTITVTGTLVNYNGNTSEFIAGCTYIAVEDSDDVSAIKDALNLVESYMTMAYKYTVTSSEVEASTEATITFDDTAKRTSYSTSQQVWEENGITITNDKDSSTSNVADYSNPVRLYKSSTVTISYPAAFTTISFYCSSTSYSIAGATLDGGTFVADETDATLVTLTLEEATTSVTITMPNQVRLNSLTVNCDEAVKITEHTYSDAEFRIRCGVDLALQSINNVTEYGISVTANGTTKYYAWNETDGIYGSDNNCLFVTISLGDAINNIDRLSTEFTVCAYVVADGYTYVSEMTKTYSIESMVVEYFGNEDTKSLVADLYYRIANDLL